MIQNALSMLPLILLIGGVWWYLRLRKNNVAVQPGGTAKKVRWGWWLAGLLGLAVIGAATSGRDDGTPKARSLTVTYQVNGTATQARVTHNNDRNGTNTQTVNLPWYVSYTVQRGDHLYLSAQNDTPNGDIEVSINVNGKPLQSSHSSGAYAVANANARCCN